ncbi:FixH family protein [Pseudooctadecabacter jejudonensis]|uniref:FixH n=1 Tax=Pseudooctadecabacter jejudonensis TaxID=1391910 RepID=A0A1Y5SUJ8_9RHOB|nr:FixH family protein [Pseudooctadecabacter jejudonensis]SLN48676.1 FixH [Pseudooctadecabacter jejudonensis]
MTELSGKHVAAIFGLGFGTIIAVNMTLAFSAVRTFPGLEVRNSYVASQHFDANRAAQTALGWDVAARLHGDTLTLTITQNGDPVRPQITAATFGRATSISADQTPDFTYENGVFTAPVAGGAGNWNLRLAARAADGTHFQQRIIVDAAP